MKEYEKVLDDLCEVSKIVLNGLKTELGNGVMNVDTKEVGEAADIVKDLAEAAKYKLEAEYYKTVIEAMTEDPTNERRGYMPSLTGNNRNSFKPMVDQEPYVDRYLNGSRNNGRSNEYGEPYHEYVEAKRHYTETGSLNDKSMMDKHAKDHVDQTIATMTEIWAGASPELKQKMKTDFTKLISTMN